MALRTSQTDLLIVGAGPAGLMAALWASQYDISARVVDDKPDRVPTGHADGLTCRTLEILDSFGLAQTICDEAAWDFQIQNWKADTNGDLKRTQTLVSQKPGVSRFQQCTLSQGRIEELMLGALEKRGTVKVERNIKTLKLKIDESKQGLTEYPIEVKILDKGSSNGSVVSKSSSFVNGDPLSNGHECEGIETIHAKFVIGADGAHSWTRREIGLTMRGDSTAHVWGVIDIVPLTDFPDIRQTCVISSRKGNIHLVPREGKIVRLYIQLDEVVGIEERFDRSKITVERLFSTAQKIFLPFKLEYARVDWWTVYQVGQRVADHFSHSDRVFLVGDAIHTHSPKVGQGMNVSMQDSYNIGWKICSVIQGTLRPQGLHSYEAERRPVALQLIQADQETVRYYTAKDTGSQVEDLQTFRNRLYTFLSGTAIDYTGSPLIAGHHSPNKKLASEICLGQRMPSFQIINHASTRPTQLGNLLASDGKWRLVIFAGDLTISTQAARLKSLTQALDTHPSLFPHSSNLTSGNQPDVQPITVISSARAETPLLSLPEILYVQHGEEGCNYNAVFTDEPDVYGNFEDAYRKYGVDRARGCLVLCRPDQHVAFIGELDDAHELEAFYASVFCSR